MNTFTEEVDELCKQRNLLVDKSSSDLHTQMYKEYAIKLRSDTTRPAIGLYRLSESATVYFYNYSLRRHTENINELKYMLDVFMQSCKMYNRGLDEMWRMWDEGRSSEERQKFGREMRTNVENFEERMMRLYDLDKD